MKSFSFVLGSWWSLCSLFRSIGKRIVLRCWGTLQLCDLQLNISIFCVNHSLPCKAHPGASCLEWFVWESRRSCFALDQHVSLWTSLRPKRCEKSPLKCFGSQLVLAQEESLAYHRVTVFAVCCCCCCCCGGGGGRRGRGGGRHRPLGCPRSSSQKQLQVRCTTAPPLLQATLREYWMPFDAVFWILERLLGELWIVRMSRGASRRSMANACGNHNRGGVTPQSLLLSDVLAMILLRFINGEYVLAGVWCGSAPCWMCCGGGTNFSIPQ